MEASGEILSAERKLLLYFLNCECVTAGANETDHGIRARMVVIGSERRIVVLDKFCYALAQRLDSVGRL